MLKSRAKKVSCLRNFQLGYWFFLYLKKTKILEKHQKPKLKQPVEAA